MRDTLAFCPERKVLDRHVLKCDQHLAVGATAMFCFMHKPCTYYENGFNVL